MVLTVTTMTRPFLLAGALLLLPPCPGAAAPPEPVQQTQVLAPFQSVQTSTHRLVGLYSPDLEEDFLRLMKSELPDLELLNLDREEAEVTLRYDVAKTFFPPEGKIPKDYTIEKARQRLLEMVRGRLKGAFYLMPPLTLPPDKLTKVEIKIGMLDCKGCRHGACMFLSKVEGVERTVIDAQTHVITAWIDGAKTNRLALEDVLKKNQVVVMSPEAEAARAAEAEAKIKAAAAAATPTK